MIGWNKFKEYWENDKFTKAFNLLVQLPAEDIRMYEIPYMVRLNHKVTVLRLCSVIAKVDPKLLEAFNTIEEQILKSTYFLECMNNGRKLAAVKYVKQSLGVRLKEAKSIVDDWQIREMKKNSSR